MLMLTICSGTPIRATRTIGPIKATALLLISLLVASCATQGSYSSGRLARVTPKDFISIKPESIVVGIDMDSRVPATLNRGPDFRVAIFPVDHSAWEPIGGRLRMRPLSLLGKKPDKAAGKALKAWMEPRAGRLRLAYVLTAEGQKEMIEIQKKFDALLKKYPPGGSNKGVLRLGADARRLIDADQKAGASIIETTLQLSIGEGPFQLWRGRIDRMR